MYSCNNYCIKIKQNKIGEADMENKYGHSALQLFWKIWQILKETCLLRLKGMKNIYTWILKLTEEQSDSFSSFLYLLQLCVSLIHCNTCCLGKTNLLRNLSHILRPVSIRLYFVVWTNLLLSLNILAMFSKPLSLSLLN